MYLGGLGSEDPSRRRRRAFAADPSLKEAMESGGVLTGPRVTWAEESDASDYTQSRAA
jgi:hypothetical protein